MKNIFLLFSFLTFIINTQAQDFFDNNNIKTIEINFVQTNWNDLLELYYTAGTGVRLIGSLSLNGIPFDSVGVRYKGNSSYITSNPKKPLNIKLDHIKGKQNINGRNVLKLSNIFGDPSAIREVLSYEIARKYLPSSESNYAKVYVNGTYLGLYVNDESTNKVFAKNHYFNNNGPFFEASYNSASTPVGCTGGAPQILGYLGTNQSCYEQYYSSQSSNPNDWNDLMAALDTFNNFSANIENVIYMDRLLWMLAINNVMVNLDSPINPPNNYLLYKDKTDRFNPIMWDLNQSFGAYTSNGNTTLTKSQLQKLSPWFNATNLNYPILNIPFSNDRYKKMYIAKMKTVFNENFNNDWYSQRITELQNLIKTEVNSDPNKFYTYNQFINNIDSTSQGVIGIKELMSERKNYLNSQVDFLKTPPVVSNIQQSPVRVTPLSQVTISAEITDANYVYLGYRISPKEKFTKIELTSSGNIYSANIPVQYSDLEYYFWAENDDAGIFSPERAEYEFHKIGVTGDLVINELQASNENTQYDEAAEYDDWLELYNNTNQDIDLTGYYLSDSKDSLTKWTIPSQIIKANDYAIFWCDNDIAQGPNHTNFNLTRSGETVYIVNPSKEIINQITYPLQVRNLSYSRIPNGTGAFRIQTPTFKANNGDGTANSIHNTEKAQDIYTLYPNPNSGIIYIQSKDQNLKGKTLRIYDNLGRKLIEQTLQNNSLEIIEANTLQKGLYIVTIDAGQGLKLLIK